ncbi:hypothetical protein VE02_00095 [Pseudogymnoascus sp. 03VT05]|nr:hypothetical protein VE02_00095 [Pseudogymnoascus sp. 03VT05]
MRSQFATTTSLRLLLLALAVSGTSAIFCDFYDENFIGGNAVSNQEELETLYAGCTEIEGTVNIAANYTGDFYFPNVTYISGGFSTEYIRTRDNDDQPIPAPLLTSIVVPDLNNTYYIDINSVPALTTISFLSLTVLNGSMSLVRIEDCAIDFPSLTSGGLIVTGNSTRYVMFYTQQPQFTVSNPIFSSLNFPKLTNVGFMRVSRNPRQGNNDYDRDHKSIDRVDQLPSI